MANVVHASSPLTLRLGRSPQSLGLGYSSPKLCKPGNLEKLGHIFTDLSNLETMQEFPELPISPPPSPVFMPTFQCNTEPNLCLEAVWNKPPGPFIFIREVKSLQFGVAVAVRELNYTWNFENSEGRVLCMKIIRKVEIVERSLLPAVVRELLAYRTLSSQEWVRGRAFVMELHGSLMDEERLFFAMDLMKCNLSDILQDDFPERHKYNKRWMAQTAMGISALHSAGILHRDIKPGNLLIDYRDNIRITDFGSAYTNGRALHHWGDYCDEVVGTWEYMAPEMVDNKRRSRHERKKYGMAVDYWALGCVAFELEAEEPQILFHSHEELRYYQKWNKSSHGGKSYLSFAGLSDEAEAVISGLLRFNPPSRFGISDLLRQPYFDNSSGFNEFDHIEARAAQRPQLSKASAEILKKPLGHPLIFSPILDTFNEPVSPDVVAFEDLSWINPKSIWGQP